MNKKAVAHIAIYNIKRWKSRYHVLFGIIYFIILGDMMLRQTRKLIPILGVKPSTFAFPLIWNSTLFLMMFFLGVILFFSDAPFTDDMTNFVLIRCGKIKWMTAQIIYIMLTSIFIALCFFLIQAVMLPPSLANGWGKFWGSIAQTNATMATGSRMKFDYNILWDYEPVEACVVVFGICILLCLFTGLFLYFFSLINLKTIGICILSGFTILPHIVSGLDFTIFYWLSPYSWICLDTTMRSYNGSLPSIGYAYQMLMIWNLGLILLIFFRTKYSKE
ncbi:MAG: hypothetical protein Q4B70_06075 [Lachnospiraceae bacterium]|nr:hypothetical protein [Lachnospiraceae bacterium]